jgi:hypothetical protein
MQRVSYKEHGETSLEREMKIEARLKEFKEGLAM